jgi:hypothetical protein
MLLPMAILESRFTAAGKRLRPASGPCILRLTFPRTKLARSIFTSLSKAVTKIGNKTAVVELTDCRFAATFFARYFRKRP